MVKININNQQNLLEINEDWESIFKKIAEKAAKIENRKDGTVSIVLTTDEHLRRLNNKFRNKDMATDVLSFPMDEKIWGDIIISVNRVIKQAEEYNHSTKRELFYLFTHGILHLLGYTHKNRDEKKYMRKKEEKILAELDLER